VLMIKKIKKLLLDNKGSSIITAMCVILIVALLSYPIFEFYQTSIVVRHIRNKGQITIDTYTIKKGKEIVHSIKNGNDYTTKLNEKLLLNDYIHTLKIDENFKGYDKDKVSFSISNIKTSFVIDKVLKTQLSYTLHVPFYFVGIPLFTRDIPVKLHSRYNLK